MTATLPAELVDPELWPLCPTFDGGQQRCVCWWAKRQSEYLDAGNEWPGGRDLGDLIAMHTQYPCRMPFDGTQV